MIYRHMVLRLIFSSRAILLASQPIERNPLMLATCSDSTTATSQKGECAPQLLNNLVLLL